MSDVPHYPTNIGYDPADSLRPREYKYLLPEVNLDLFALQAVIIGKKWDQASKLIRFGDKITAPAIIECGRGDRLVTSTAAR